MIAAPRRISFVLSAALVLFAGCASASDWARLVRAVGRQPGMERQHVPMFGLARTAVRTLHPNGVYDLRLAIFESRGEGVTADPELDAAIRDVPSRGWSPVVRVSSADGERTTIWARPGERGIQMLLLARERHEAVVMQIEMDPERFFDALDRPGSFAVIGRSRE